MRAMRAAGFDDDTVYAVAVAMEEAIVNAHKHGNGADERKKIEIDWDVTPQRVKVTVEDEGDGFDPADLPDPCLPENIEKPSGRGVMMMRHFMTSVEYNERGNKVALCKDRKEQA